MAAVSQKIPNLLGGISQQPDPVKLPGQVRDARNVYLDPTFGARKRPPTEFIATLATDVPEAAKWFPIFRDNNERYAVAMYTDGTTGEFVVRAWSMNDGVEAPVVINDDAIAYFDGVVLDDISQVTIADYTLIANKGREVTMSKSNVDVSVNEEALVTVNQVAYNSTYSIDLDGSSGTIANEVQGATKITVSPGSFGAYQDGGGCPNTGAQEHLVNLPADGKTGLSFRLIITCYAEYVDSNPSDPYPGYYESRYRAAVQLNNGGTGWEVGDVVQVSQGGWAFRITVQEVGTVLAYNSDGTVSYTTPANTAGGVLNIAEIVQGLADQVNNNITNYSADSVGNVIRITKTNGERFGISARGGVANTAMEAIKGQAQDVSALPNQCFDGYILKVSNTAETDSDDYYVRFTTQSAGARGAGSWEETVKPGIDTSINPGTMPQALIRQSDGTFTLGPLNNDSAFGGWGAREVGDEDTNPEPSFIGKGISGLFFYMNRMGILCEDAVIMSQPGNYFNYWVVSALTISDADPIDLVASSTEPAILKAAVGAPKGLILFAERSQFLLSTSEIAFAPGTVKMAEISSYYYKSPIQPLSTGISIAFPSENRTYTKILEMAVDSVENRPEVADITRILPEYLPSGLEWGEVLPNNNMILYGDKSESVYVFKFFNQGNERQIAGWTRWVFPQKIMMWGSEDDMSSIVAYDNGRHTLLRMELVDDPDDAPLTLPFSSFTPRLDSYVTRADVTIQPYDTLFNKVLIPEDLRVIDVQYVLISTSASFKATFVRPNYIIDGNDWYLIVEKKLSDGDFYLGIEYIASVELPSIFMTQEGRSDRVNIPIVENLYLDLYYSGSYEVSIQKLGYPTQDLVLEVVPANIYDADEPPIQEISTLNVPIFSRGDIVKTTVLARDPYPCSITGYSWEGHYNNRGISPIR